MANPNLSSGVVQGSTPAMDPKAVEEQLAQQAANQQAAAAQVKAKAGEIPIIDDEEIDQPADHGMSGGRVPGSETVEGGRFWIPRGNGHVLANCNGEVLGRSQPRQPVVKAKKPKAVEVKS